MTVHVDYFFSDWRGYLQKATPRWRGRFGEFRQDLRGEGVPQWQEIYLISVQLLVCPSEASAYICMEMEDRLCGQVK